MLKIINNILDDYFAKNLIKEYFAFNKLQKALTDAINHPEILAVSIATRPDCLPKEVIELLENLNKIKPRCQFFA